jgi:hypothetical protein
MTLFMMPVLLGIKHGGAEHVPAGFTNFRKKLTGR